MSDFSEYVNIVEPCMMMKYSFLKPDQVKNKCKELFLNSSGSQRKLCISKCLAEFGSNSIIRKACKSFTKASDVTRFIRKTRKLASQKCKVYEFRTDCQKPNLSRSLKFKSKRELSIDPYDFVLNYNECKDFNASSARRSNSIDKISRYKPLELTIKPKKSFRCNLRTELIESSESEELFISSKAASTHRQEHQHSYQSKSTITAGSVSIKDSKPMIADCQIVFRNKFDNLKNITNHSIEKNTESEELSLVEKTASTGINSSNPIGYSRCKLGNRKVTKCTYQNELKSGKDIKSAKIFTSPKIVRTFEQRMKQKSCSRNASPFHKLASNDCVVNYSDHLPKSDSEALKNFSSSDSEFSQEDCKILSENELNSSVSQCIFNRTNETHENFCESTQNHCEFEKSKTMYDEFQNLHEDFDSNSNIQCTAKSNFHSEPVYQNDIVKVCDGSHLFSPVFPNYKSHKQVDKKRKKIRGRFHLLPMSLKKGPAFFSSHVNVKPIESLQGLFAAEPTTSSKKSLRWISQKTAESAVENYMDEGDIFG